MSVAFPEVTISSREVDLDAATASVRYGEVDVAFGLDYPDAPMPRDKSLQLVRLQPETFAVAVGSGRLDPGPWLAEARRPERTSSSTSSPSWTGSCLRRARSTGALSVPGSGVAVSSRAWCTR